MGGKKKSTAKNKEVMDKENQALIWIKALRRHNQHSFGVSYGAFLAQS
jgi:hypothetical protein